MNWRVAERAGEGEGSDEEVAMGEADLDAAEERADGGAVGGEVEEVPCDEGAGGDGRLHQRLPMNAWVFAVDGLHHLVRPLMLHERERGREES